MTNIIEQYHNWRRSTFPASKEDVAWRHNAVDFRLARIDTTVDEAAARLIRIESASVAALSALQALLDKSGAAGVDVFANAQVPGSVVELRKELEKYKHEARIRQIIGQNMIRYVVLGLRTPDVSTTLSVTRPYYALDVDSVLEHPMIEEDFSVFRFFDNPAETILDIGAHVGFAVSAMIKSGSRASVLSFEANPLHHPALKKLKDRLPDRFDFVPSGLSSKEGKVRFVIPVVEGAAMTTLSTANIENAMDWAIPENLLIYCMAVIPDVPNPRIQFCEDEWSLARLDDLLAREKPSVPVNDIVAVKIDVEGHEADVIAGGKETLARHKPMLMIEGGNRVEKVVRQLHDLGYLFAEYSDERLRLHEGMGLRVNGFYVHKDRLNAYIASGLVVSA